MLAVKAEALMDLLTTLYLWNQQIARTPEKNPNAQIFRLPETSKIENERRFVDAELSGIAKRLKVQSTDRQRSQCGVRQGSVLCVFLQSRPRMQRQNRRADRVSITVLRMASICAFFSHVRNH